MAVGQNGVKNCEINLQFERQSFDSRRSLSNELQNVWNDVLVGCNVLVGNIWFDSGGSNRRKEELQSHRRQPRSALLCLPPLHDHPHPVGF